MVLRRDRCVYRETAVDSSTKPRYRWWLSYCYRARLADLGQDTGRVIERGEERGGGVEAWLWPSSKYRLSYCQQGF